MSRAATDADKAPAELTAAERLDMLRQVRQGEPLTLTITAITTREPKKPSPLPFEMKDRANANFGRLRIEELPAFADSFVGRPFLRDHNRRDLLAVGGEILSSELVELDDEFVLRQRIRLVKAWSRRGCPGRHAAVFFQLRGTRSIAVHLVSANLFSAPCAMARCSRWTATTSPARS